MVPDRAQEELDLYHNSKRETIRVQIPDGPLLIMKGWDLRSNLLDIIFKTDSNPDIIHERLTVEELNESPKIYRVIILK